MTDPFAAICGLDDLKDEARYLAAEELPVLITGETGVGKNLFAAAIHRASPRRARRMVTVHCPTVPSTLFESEVFGHRRGAFTDAHEDRPGAVEVAEGGTLFFDETGDLPAQAQAKLLRVVEEHRYRRVGDSEERTADIRCLFATNHDLAALVREGRFRSDLYYRIALHELHIPPVRERREEIPRLADFLWRQLTDGEADPLRSAEVGLLADFSFPGNVRELRGILEQLWLRWRLDASRSRYEVLAEILRRHGQAPAGQASGSVLLQRHVQRMIEEGASFWDAVHRPYLRREISRAELFEVLRVGLDLSGGSWKRLVPIFRVGEAKYKKFLDFVHKQGFSRHLHRRPGGDSPLAREGASTQAGQAAEI